MNLLGLFFCFHGVVLTRFQTYFIENSNNQILFAYELNVYGLIDYVGQGLQLRNYNYER